MTDIPDAAIEAATEAMSEAEVFALTGSHAAYRQRIARVAIEAAMPAIREAIAQEIEAAIENPSDDTVDAYHFDGLDEAARIVRGAQ